MKQNYFPDVADAALLEIRRERGIEMALEGFRFDDIVRWKHGELMTKVVFIGDLNGDHKSDSY